MDVMMTDRRLWPVMILCRIHVAMQRHTGYIMKTNGIIINPDFDSNCGFCRENMNNINERVCWFAKV
jgi:hypothetical protein